MANGFLVIERQKDQSIMLFDDDSEIEIMICGIRGDQGNERIRIGIKAPEKYKIHRKESHRKIKE